MTLDDFTRLADDGCPNCPEHAFYHDPEPVPFEAFVIVIPIGWVPKR